MDVCRNAVPHVGTCIVVHLSPNNDTHIFRAMKAPGNQCVCFCAKLVIFAHIGPVIRELREGQYVYVPPPCWRANAAKVHAGTDTVTRAELSHLGWHTPEGDPFWGRFWRL